MVEGIDNIESKTKVYTLTKIGLATFIGGPLAAGYMMNVNFKILGKPNTAKNAIILGVLSTILLWVGILSIPESLMDKVPRFIIPLIYSAVVYFLVEKYQGEELKEFAKNKDSLYSIWRAIGIGFISLAILLAGFFAYFFIIEDNEVYEQYDQQMAAFYENEEQALKFYDNINSKSDASLLEEVNLTMIPNWEQNIKITEKIGITENLPSDLLEQNNVFLEYSKLRLKLSFLIKESILQQKDKRMEIEEISNQIESVLNTLK